MQIQGTTPLNITQIHGPHGVNGPNQNNGATPPSRAATQHTGTGDQLDISPAAEAAIRTADHGATDNGGIRADLVSRVRNEIAAGTYETPEKLDGALDRLLNEIG